MDKENFKLNVTDLMVGDWVFCYHPLSSVKARHQVTPEILDLMYRMSVGRLAEDNPTYRIIEPIPLTTQILESTFKIDQTGRGWTLCRIRYDVDLRIGFSGGKLYLFVAYFSGTITLIRTLNYVHELQHIIRMFDIPLEVKL